MLIPLLVLAFLLLLNGIFAMSELAMMTSRRSRLQQAAAAGSKGAATALALSHEPTRFLSTVQVGITMIGILSGAFGENALSGALEEQVSRVAVLEPYADTISLVIVVIAITYFSLVVGELVPKRIALAYPEAVASIIARPLNQMSIIGALPVKVLSFSTEMVLKALHIKTRQGDDVSEEDVKALIARAASTGVFTPQELKLFQRTMRAGDLHVSDLMVSRMEIVWIEQDEPIDSIRVLIGTSPYSHFPVCKGGIDHVIGVVHVKDLIAHGLIAGREFKVVDVAQKPLFVPDSMPALRLLDQFQQSKNHIAFVVDEFGGTLGMLTFNDVTRAIVGDVSRKGDPGVPTLLRREDGSWLVDGRLALHELVIALQLPAETEDDFPDVRTVAGLTAKVLGHIPAEGEKLHWLGHEVEIVDMDGVRVDKVLVKKVANTPLNSAQT